MPVSGFISRSACRGRRPSQLVSCIVRSRPALVARLLKNRDVVRFIVAPSGYGKSFLALEYAETMKLWAHTFWVNAQSPCFVRELDEEALAAFILEFDPESPLVILDDLPLLDDARQAQLSKEIDMLLAEGCEVIVTCTPSCDALGSLQRDRQRLSASSLLLSDEELDETRSADERARKPANQIGPARRVPLLAWSSASDYGEQFVKGTLEEELPNDVLLILGSAYVLGTGNLSDLLSLGPLEQHIFEEMKNDYPHLGIDLESERFEAPSLKIEEMATVLRSSLPQLVERSSYAAGAQLIRAWARILMRNAQASRACSTIQELFPMSHRASWVIDNAIELVRQACFVPLFRLTVSLRTSAGEIRMRLNVIEALCRQLLGDEQGAIQCAKKSAFKEKGVEDARIIGLIIVAKLNAGVLSQQATDTLRALLLEKEPIDIRSCSNWILLGKAWQASIDGIDSLAKVWSQYFDEHVNDDVLCICASWLFGAYMGSRQNPHLSEPPALRQAELYVRERLSDSAQHNAPDFFLSSAGLSLEEAHSSGLAYKDGSLETASLIQLRETEMSVLSQRRLFTEDERIEQARRADWIKTHPNPLSSLELPGTTGQPERSIPILTLKMFGCFEASIGGMPLEYTLFKRQNTRTLLVLLAVNQGRELSRDVLAEAMWPKSTLSVARKNFYATWSHLRRALSLPDGTCPYLVRHRFGCSLDGRFVQSDTKRFNEICRELLFGSPNIEHWALLFAEIDRDFSSDLMPAELDNGLIAQSRNDYKTRLVDALVAATDSIIGADIPQWGVWFARAAVQHDDTREDAYVALMRAQIAGNQRTAAMMTYLKCRRALADKLGIDPSPETTALYESLLDSE